MPPDLIKLMVSEVTVAVPAGPGVEAGMVTLAEIEEPRRRLRIVIAQPEARAIHAAWTGSIPARPSTWDLFVSSVALLGARIDRAVITAVEEDRHFFASLDLLQGGERRTMTCRPSDAVAIILRAYGADLVAAAHVLDTAGLAPDGTKYGPYLRPEPEPEPGREAQPGPEDPAAGDDTRLGPADVPGDAPAPGTGSDAAPAPRKRAPAVKKRAPGVSKGAADPATESPPAKKAPGRNVPGRKAPAKKVPVKKTPAKRAPAKRAPVKKVPATEPVPATELTPDPAAPDPAAPAPDPAPPAPGSGGPAPDLGSTPDPG